jgi:hypothetical protein
MAKATAVFAQQGQFLTFPMTPIVWQASRLGFQDGALSPVDTINAMAEFSHMVNVVPVGVMYPSTEESIISDVLHDVFAAAILARSIRTPQEEADYQTALAELFKTRPDGLRDPTPKYQAYQQWEDAWTLVKQNINQRAIDAQSTSDPAIKQSWQRDEPALDAHLNEVMAQWQTAGFKDEIEHALRIIGDLGAKSPDQTWQGWRSQFGEAAGSGATAANINALTTPTGETFLPTGFSPIDALRDGAWQQFTLSRAEITNLVALAPPELRARLDPTQQLDVDRISFEYTSAQVTRPWGPPADMFSAKFWKLPRTARALSDGAPAPSGRLTALISGIVFARNIQTVAATPPPPTPPPPPPPHPIPVHWGAVVGQPPLMTFHPAFAGSVAHVATPGASAPTRMMMAAAPARATIAATAAPAPMPAQKVQLVNTAVTRLQVTGTQRIVVPPPQLSSPPPPPPPPPPVPPDIYVLALIYRLVPRSPNPDPALTW